MKIDKHSFTLIELLIVLVIIGILATLAVPQYQDYVNKARCAEAKTMLRAWSNAIWQYYIETGNIPVNQNDIGFTVPPSQYFTYGFDTGSPGLGLISAESKFKGSNGLPYRTYQIYYILNPVAPDMQPGAQMMDTKWSRLYVHYNFSESTSVKYGWD